MYSLFEKPPKRNMNIKYCSRKRKGTSPMCPKAQRTVPLYFYVFAKQSLGPIHCGLVSQAPLLPKLRGHFAEFLNKGSPVRLRILSSPTCVGLRYGHQNSSIAAFLASVKSMASLLIFGPHHSPGFTANGTSLICLPHCLDEFLHKLAPSILLCHCFCQTELRWYRNFNRLSIAYGFRPRLRSRLTLSGRTFLRKP
jgi:hypothetical protein